MTVCASVHPQVNAITGALELTNKIAIQAMTPLKKVTMLSQNDVLDDASVQVCIDSRILVSGVVHACCSGSIKPMPQFFTCHTTVQPVFLCPHHKCVVMHTRYETVSSLSLLTTQCTFPTSGPSNHDRTNFHLSSNITNRPHLLTVLSIMQHAMMAWHALEMLAWHALKMSRIIL